MNIFLSKVFIFSFWHLQSSKSSLTPAMNGMNSVRIQTWFTDFSFYADSQYTTHVSQISYSHSLTKKGKRKSETEFVECKL